MGQITITIEHEGGDCKIAQTMTIETDLAPETLQRFMYYNREFVLQKTVDEIVQYIEQFKKNDKSLHKNDKSLHKGFTGLCKESVCKESAKIENGFQEFSRAEWITK